MSHVDDGTLHALVDDALDDGERAAVEAHLASCGDCARRFAEATAMSRQVLSLLGALDDVPAPVRIEPAATRTIAVAAGNLPTPVMPSAPPLVTLRRIALAASLLLVAGLSYEVGSRRDAAPRTATAPETAPTSSPITSPAPRVAMDSTRVGSTPPAMPAASIAPRSAARGAPALSATRMSEALAASPAVAPSPATLSAPMMPVPPAPSVTELAQQKAVAGRQGVVASEVVADREAQGASGQVASRRATGVDGPVQQQRAVRSQDQSRNYVSGVGAVASDAAAPGTLGWITATGPRALAGYQAADDVIMPAVARRRYVATDGTIVVLLIARSTTEAPKPTATASTEFTVSTVNGRSTVRWQVRGLTYELQGALPPDSLVKLATQLK